MEFQVVDWHDEDRYYPEELNTEVTEPEYPNKMYTIYMFGRMENRESVCIVVKNYKPSFFILVPKNIARSVSEYELFNSIKNKAPNWLKYKIISGKYVKRMKGYGFTNNEKFTFMELSVDNMMAFYGLRKMIGGTHDSDFGEGVPATPIVVNGIKVKFSLYESNIEQLLRFIHKRDLEASGWINIEEKYLEIIEPEYKESYCTHEAHVDWNHVSKLKEIKANAPFVVASFDIEANSLLDNKTGYPIEGNNAKVIQIGTTFTRHGEKEPYLKHIVCLKKCNPIEGATVESYSMESTVLRSWARVIRKQDPDVIIGYNIWGYDLAFVFRRMEAFNLNDTDIACFGRLNFKHCKVKRSSFSSGAYGSTEMWKVPMIGRCQIDLLIEIRKSHKLNSYRLNSVSEYFLGDHKLDVNYKQILDWFVEGKVEKITKIAEYCIQDTMLPQRLLDHKKLNILTNLIEMSKISEVPLQFILEKGQLIKGFSQIAKEAMKEGYLLQVLPPFQGSGKYEGAHVFTPKTGFYEVPITGLDFASLYPSIMIAYKLCHTNYVIDDEKYGNIEGVNYKTFDFPSTFKNEDNTKTTVQRHYKFAQDNEGLLPKILSRLWQGRKATKRLMKDATDPNIKSMLNGKQLAQKVSMNSIYGFCGASIGRYPLMSIADVTTYMGRESILKCAKVAKDKYDCDIIYGDSVSFDTPILIREIDTGIIDVVTIGTIPWDSLEHRDAYKRKWNCRNELVSNSLGENKEDSEVNQLEAWTKNGWTKIHKVIRHQTNKKMYRVHTRVGIIDVTEDHSILNDKAEVIKPGESMGSILLSGLPRNVGENVITKKDVIYRVSVIKSMFVLD